MEAIETLAAQLHAIYQHEAKRQYPRKPHSYDYADLPENIKEFDRVLARFILEREASLTARLEQAERERNDYSDMAKQSTSEKLIAQATNAALRQVLVDIVNGVNERQSPLGYRARSFMRRNAAEKEKQ